MITTKPNRILVPTDFSDTANHAMHEEQQKLTDIVWANQ